MLALLLCTGCCKLRASPIPEPTLAFTGRSGISVALSGQTAGYTFTPLQTFTVLGLSAFAGVLPAAPDQLPVAVNLFDANTYTLLRTANVSNASFFPDNWGVEFVDPIVLTTGNSYMLAVHVPPTNVSGYAPANMFLALPPTYPFSNPFLREIGYYISSGCTGGYYCIGNQESLVYPTIPEGGLAVGNLWVLEGEQASAVPEAETYAMIGSALVALGLLRRRKEGLILRDHGFS